jgi:peptide/nickel transport system permease protein
MMTRLLRHPTAALGLAILSVMLLLAVAGPLVAPPDYFATDLEGTLRGPAPGHPFGQDKLGRDVFWQVVIGARTSVLVALAVVFTTAVVGCLLGAAAGYFGGIVDLLVMRTVDILLAVALAGVLGPSLWNVILVLSLLGWVGYARLVRAQFLSLREREYVQAARALGAGSRRIILRHIFPNALSPVIVQATFSAAAVILAESSLSFLGLGPQDSPSWGSLLSQGVNFLGFGAHIALFPGLFIMLTVLALNLVGDVLRDLLDPKSGQGTRALHP